MSVEPATKRAALVAGIAIVLLAGVVQLLRPHGERASWADEFDGPAGAAPAAHWKRLEGGGGWGNNELQVYRPSNAVLDGAGHLQITARREADGTFTSARLESTVAFGAGRVEARLKVPAGQGLWSAFWTLGAGHERIGWPRVGEIDVVEALNDVREVHANVHLEDPSAPDGRRQAQGTFTPDEPLAEDWHVYGAEWSSDAVSFSFDGETYHRVERGDGNWPFDRPQVLLLNLAVGGNWPGAPDGGTPFPSSLLVDYVRVFEG